MEGMRMSTTKESLYERLGGRPAIAAIVDQFYERVLRDLELVVFFGGTGFEKQRKHMVAFFIRLLGGPDEYVGQSLREAHRGMGIEERHFVRLVCHLQSSLESAGVELEDLHEIMSVAMSFQDDVLDR
jgi:hemoglobin